MFKKTVHELFRCKGSRLFVILMLVNFALSCVMPALNGGFVDFLVTNRDPSRVVWFAAFVAGIGISASFMSYAMGVNVSRVILEMTTRLMGTTCESFERGPLEKGEQADPSYTTQRVYADSNAVSSFVVNNFLTIGLNIVLPHEQAPNAYVTPDLSFNFHYFAIRKMHFLMRARAVVVFPGGFGTLDELSEALTLIQTNKIGKFPIVLVGSEFWSGLLDWFKDTLLKEGLIAEHDLLLFRVVDNAEDAVAHIKAFYDKYSVSVNF